MKVRVHPIQLKFANNKCGICGAHEPKRHETTPDRVAHMVHLVKEHLKDVEYANSSKGLTEEIAVDLEVFQNVEG